MFTYHGDGKLSHISADTKAILLLCSGLGSRSGEIKPLTTLQYSKLASWLHNRHLRPRDLLENNHRGVLSEHSEKDRIVKLLGRGVALALIVEEWAAKGIWVVSRADDDYPTRWKRHFQQKRPALLFGIGNKTLLQGGGVAIVGSRNASSEDLKFTRDLGVDAARKRQVVVSGGARGVDQTAMIAALEHGGQAVGILPQGVDSEVTKARWRAAIKSGDLVLVATCDPGSRFEGYRAMNRNKLVYTLAHCAVVVATDENRTGKKSGTWTGAQENLKKNWVPLFVQIGPGVKAGNIALLREGGSPLDRPEVPSLDDAIQNADTARAEIGTQSLFSEPFTETKEPDQVGTSEPLGKSGETPEVSSETAAISTAPGLKQNQKPPEPEPVSAPELALELGSAPLPEPAPESEEPVAAAGPTKDTITSKEALAANQTDSVVSPPEATPKRSLFEAFLQVLLPLLDRGALTMSQVASELGIVRSQSKAWLQEAIDGGDVEKISRGRYQIKQDDGQGNLFNSERTEKTSRI